MDGRNLLLAAPAIAGVLSLLTVGTPVVLAETSETTVGIGSDNLDVRLDRYIERQRFRPRHESRERLPARPLGLRLSETWDSDETDAPILACALPALSLQDDPATQQSGAEGDERSQAAGHTPAHKRNTDDINNQLNNPGADLAQLNFRFTWNHFTGNAGKMPSLRKRLGRLRLGQPIRNIFRLKRSSRGEGASSQNSMALNFQPVIPFKLDDGGTLIFRLTIPMLWQSHYNGRSNGFDEQFGLGDTQIVGFYSRTNKEKGYMWGAGLAMQFPTHTDDSLGKDQFQIGPAGFVGMMGKWGSVGVFPQHLWNVGGSNDGYTAITVIQPWYWFSVGKGYQVGGSPLILIDWAEDDSDEKWTVPFNLGIAKTIKMGDTPVKLKLEGIYYIVQPDSFGPQFGLQLSIIPVVKNPFERHVANN